MRLPFAFLLVALGCAHAPEPMEDRLLDTLPEKASVRDFRFSRDGRRAAYVRFLGGSDAVVVNGRVVGKPLSLI